MNTDVLSNLVIKRVYSASTLYTPENAKAKRTDRPGWAVVIKYEGETVYEARGKSIVSDINHVTILPKGCSYDWECTRSGHFSILEFESDASFAEPLSFPVKHSEKLVKMLKELEYKRNLKGETVELESIRDAYSIILSVILASTDKYQPEGKRQRL